MKSFKRWKRCAALFLALALVFTNLSIRTESVQAASKSVKSVSLKIGNAKVTKKTVTMYSGDSKTLKVAISPKNAKKKVSFTSSKKSVASVSKKGVITAKKSGTSKVKVTVTDKKNRKKTVYVNVKVKYVSLSLNKKTVSIKEGQSLALRAKVAPKKKVKWSTSNSKVVTVTSKGVIKGKKAGTAKVTARVGNKSATCNVTVKGSGVGNSPDVNVSNEVKVKELHAAVQGGDTVYVGHSKLIVTTIVPANATNKTLSYSSSNTGVAQVNERGAILGISAGTAKITIKAAGNVSTTLNVKVVEVPVESVSVTPGELELQITETANLTAKILPAEASEKLVNWSSDNMEIASVDANGKVTGRAVGTTEIKAKVAGSDRFGVCTVKVVNRPTGKDGISMEVTNSYIDNVGNEYQNTVLFGRDMSLRVHLQRDGQPVGGKNINLALKPAYGNASDCFEIRSTNEKTDSDGYANFQIGLKSEYSVDLDAVCGKWQSFIVIARDSSSNETAELTASFATVQLDKIEVLSEIVPSQNASFADDGIYETVSTNGSKKVQYVTSQQVSSETENHAVRLDAQPYLLLPATKTSAHSGEWNITFPNENGSGTSGSYSIYNDATNETTTTTVQEVPAGLNYLSVSFDKVKLSKYTAIYMDLYDAETGTLIEHKELTETNNGIDSNFSFEKQANERSYLVISLVSQGQVETDAEGYVIKEITGAWTNTSNQKAETVELQNAVKWEKVAAKFSEPNVLQDVYGYVPSGLIPDNYEYKYKVPAFPQVGNAIIEAKDPNGSVTEYFVYPSVNAKSGSSYENKNSLAIIRKASKAVYLGQDDVTRSVGNLAQDGNVCVVDSTQTGMTTIKAVINVEGLTSDELNSQNGGTLYSSIQWVPVPNSAILETVPDYYALEGQSVTITAQVVDSRGNNVSGEKLVSFKYNGGSIASGQLSNSGDTAADYVSVTNYTDGTTDKNGKAVLKLTGVNSGYVEGLTATCENFNVKLTIGTNTQEQFWKTNIYWVDLGLTYVNSAVKTDVPARSTNFGNSVVGVSTQSNSAVGKSWRVGFRPVAKSHKFAYTDPEKADRPVQANEFISVSNIPITYSLSGEGSYRTEGNTAILSSQQTGTSELTGKINLPQDTSNVVFTFYDEDGNKVSHKNMGDNASGTTTGNTGLLYQMHWNTSGEQVSVQPKNGIYSLARNQDTEVYVIVSDKYGNAISGANVEYTVSGCHKDMGTQQGTTDAKGRVTISLPAPSTLGATEDSTIISVIVDRDHGLQGSITITYN